MIGHLFQRPAKGRFERLFASLGLSYLSDDLDNFVKCRNSAVHAGGTPSLEKRVKAMFFGHTMVGRCALAKLDYKGSVFSEPDGTNITNVG